ncbi:hypothetical protein JDM601_3023 [Mycolicibacter sinensis]|uniref:Uncharacterized protein n=1 Tax=Mycolicibacter sinensis (strain JDM601) TaxID=875328 RepID=F5Z223_MYCSD|nr:hypothetical protein JDM601_3023 [Mycolicibacter sinensis]
MSGVIVTAADVHAARIHGRIGAHDATVHDKNATAHFGPGPAAGPLSLQDPG